MALDVDELPCTDRTVSVADREPRAIIAARSNHLAHHPVRTVVRIPRTMVCPPCLGSDAISTVGGSRIAHRPNARTAACYAPVMLAKTVACCIALLAAACASTSSGVTGDPVATRTDPSDVAPTPTIEDVQILRRADALVVRQSEAAHDRAVLVRPRGRP
jgi:hypothetical protein